jgi:hypothetical protein
LVFTKSFYSLDESEIDGAGEDFRRKPYDQMKIREGTEREESGK